MVVHKDAVAGTEERLVRRRQRVLPAQLAVGAGDRVVPEHARALRTEGRSHAGGEGGDELTDVVDQGGR